MQVVHTLLSSAEVEQRLADVISSYGIKKISVPEIKKRIYDADGNPMEASMRFMKWWMQKLPKKHIDLETMNDEILQAFQDAWNAFPHKSLNGKSPQEMVQEYAAHELPKCSDQEDLQDDALPMVHVGCQTMSYPAYQAMLERMEEEQRPFKKWIEEEALPKYFDFLSKRYKTQKAIEKHHGVARVFLERCLHVGFIDFEQIRPEFAIWEFSAWWETHVFDSKLIDEQVWRSLCDFFCFTEMVFNRKIPRLWEMLNEE